MHHSIRRFNSTLNKSVHHQDIFWKDYRQHITSIILSNIKSRDRIIIIGAGMCYDLDLKSLLESCEHMALVDVDEEALKSGLKRYEISVDCNSIELVQADVTGLESIDFVNQFYHLIKNNSTIREIKLFLNHNLTDRQIPGEFKPLLEQYDVVITMPIYTQLMFTQITSILRDLTIGNLLSPYYTQNIQEVVLELMPKLIRNYNYLLQSLCRKSGLIIAFSDLIEASPEHEIMINIKDKLQDNDAMDSFMNEYINQYGYGLGTYGMTHLKESLHVTNQHYLIWPFTKTREFLVSGIIGQRLSK